jgi:hypothetical protein
MFEFTPSRGILNVTLYDQVYQGLEVYVWVLPNILVSGKTDQRDVTDRIKNKQYHTVKKSVKIKSEHRSNRQKSITPKKCL